MNEAETDTDREEIQLQALFIRPGDAFIVDGNRLHVVSEAEAFRNNYDLIFRKTTDETN